MVNRCSQSAFPLRSSVFYLTALAAAITCILYFVVLAALEPSGDGAEAVLWTGIICWLAGLLGLLPVALAGSRAVMTIVRAYFTGAAIRMLLSLLAVLLFVKWMKFPTGPVVVTLLAVYLPMLYLETYLVVRHVKEDAFNEIAPVQEGVQ